jgi:hypothetical protein
MTKKNFEDELIHGMQRELRGHDKNQGMDNLVKAAEYLHSAMDILEENGLSKSADQILNILSKIAVKHDSNVREMPSLRKLMEHGVSEDDLKDLPRGSSISKARVNTAFRSLGYTDKEIASIIGKHNLMGEEEAHDILNGPYQKFMGWMQNPTTPVDPNHLQPGEEISMTSLPAPAKPPALTPAALTPGSEIKMQSVMGPKGLLPPGEDLVFKSIAQELGLIDDDNDASESRHHKPKNPGNIHSPSPEQMVENLKGHGTVFNLADDGFADDLLNVEISEDPIEVMDHGPGKTFEDSD